MPQKSGPSPAMSLISPTTTDPKIQPAADTSEGGGGGIVGGIVHLTIPIVIPSVKMEQGVPSITVPPLVISGDNNNKPYEIGSSPAIKAEQTDELNSSIGAGGGTNATPRGEAEGGFDRHRERRLLRSHAQEFRRYFAFCQSRDVPCDTLGTRQATGY